MQLKNIHAKKQDFLENTFEPEDIFTTAFIEGSLLSNSTYSIISVTMSTFYGRCYTVQEKGSKLQVYLKNQTDLGVNVHKCGDEYWTLFPVPPIALSFTKIPVFILSFLTLVNILFMLK